MVMGMPPNRSVTEYLTPNRTRNNQTNKPNRAAIRRGGALTALLHYCTTAQAAPPTAQSALLLHRQHRQPAYCTGSPSPTAQTARLRLRQPSYGTGSPPTAQTALLRHRQPAYCTNNASTAHAHKHTCYFTCNLNTNRFVRLVTRLHCT